MRGPSDNIYCGLQSLTPVVYGIIDPSEHRRRDVPMGLQFNEQRRAFMDKQAENGDERPDGSVMVRREVLCLRSEFFKPRITVQLHNGDALVAQLWSCGCRIPTAEYYRCSASFKLVRILT